MGFKIKTEAVVDNSVPESTVLRMDPPSGQSVAYGSTVTVFYAIDNEGKIAVPSVVGQSLNEARAELIALGLKVNVKYEEAPSGKAGLVLEQSIAADTTVLASDTEITLVVGTSSVKGTGVTITLPALSDYGDIYESVYVYVGDSLYKTYSSVKLDGSTHTIDISGTGSTTFTIFIGDQQVCSGNVDFTSSTPTITDKTDSQYQYNGGETTTAAITRPPETTTSSTCTVPSYSGKEYLTYYNELINSGFDNIVVIDTVSDTVPAGQVVSVSSDKSTYQRDEALQAEIRVYVSTGPAAEE